MKQLSKFLLFDFTRGMEGGGRAGTQNSVHKPQLLKKKESRSGIEPRSVSAQQPCVRFPAKPNRLTLTVVEARHLLILGGGYSSLPGTVILSLRCR